MTKILGISLVLLKYKQPTFSQTFIYNIVGQSETFKAIYFRSNCLSTEVKGKTILASLRSHLG